jgi:hypothetical protein
MNPLFLKQFVGQFFENGEVFRAIPCISHWNFPLPVAAMFGKIEWPKWHKRALEKIC